MLNSNVSCKIISKWSSTTELMIKDVMIVKKVKQMNKNSLKALQLKHKDRLLLKFHSHMKTKN